MPSLFFNAERRCWDIAREPVTDLMAVPCCTWKAATACTKRIQSSDGPGATLSLLMGVYETAPRAIRLTGL